jgi:photosystem II stability/assembly factor-like uncharacterized protein
VKIRSIRDSRSTLAVLVAVMAAGCLGGPDLSAAQAQAARPLQRYDMAQALAANDKVVVAGTQSGVVLISSDQGKTWTRKALGPVSLIGLATCPDGSFVAIDFYHKVWSADASAANWQPHGLDKPHTPLAVSCDVQGRWWVAGSGAAIAGSADQGATWHITDLGEDAQFTAIQFPDVQRGYALGEFGLLAVTDDGGKTWAKGPALPGEFYPYAALFVGRDEGWASGIAGQILHTADGGKSWQRQANAAGAPLYRLFLHDSVPHGVGAVGVVARLVGDTWQPVPYPDPVPVPLSAAASLPGQSALVAGGPGGLLRVIGTSSATHSTQAN